MTYGTSSYYTDKLSERSTYDSGSAVQGASQIAPVAPPSLEQRLEFLCRGIERAYMIRNKLANIADALAVDPTNRAVSGASAPATDLSGRFGDSIGYLHSNLDELEWLIARIDRALFDEKKVAEPTRAAR